MEDAASKKENDGRALNASGGKAGGKADAKTPVKRSGKQRGSAGSAGSVGSVGFEPEGMQRLRNETFSSHTCSPVREEPGDGEEFLDDPEKLEKKFARDYQKARKLTPGSGQRRQTLGAASGLSKRRGARLSLGGSSQFEQHAMNDLREELNKREKLDLTRQHRLNAMDIRKKELENKLQLLQSKFKELKREKDELVRANNELKKKNKQLVTGKRRLEEQKQQQERTISALLAKVGSGGAGGITAATRARRAERAEASPKPGTPASAVGVDEEFQDGDAVLPKARPTSAVHPSDSRRYTVAPGEASRIRSSSRVRVAQSHSIRVDLPAGSMSKNAFDLCKEYGLVVHARVTKCVVTGEFKGYLTFADASSVKAAIKGLRAKGLKAIRVEDS